MIFVSIAVSLLSASFTLLGVAIYMISRENG
jgi:hypothetical protein